MRQSGVILERRFILPARMNVEQLRVANRPKRVNAQAAQFLARRSEDVKQRFCHGALVTGTHVKSRKDEQLHFVSPSGLLDIRAATHSGSHPHCTSRPPAESVPSGGPFWMAVMRSGRRRPPRARLRASLKHYTFDQEETPRIAAFSWPEQPSLLSW